MASLPSFGTDGVRGVANAELTPELALALGRATVRAFGAGTVHIGTDTRRSGPLLVSAFAAGAMAEGAQVVTLGVVPTPAVAWSAARSGSAGAMVSASHNPFADNGIKLFAPGGRKLADDVERRLEADLAAILARPAATVADAPVGAAVGSLRSDATVLDGYVAHLVGSVEGRRLDGMRIVVDCANGSAGAVAPTVLGALGATVEVLHAAPDGTNINDACGSTHPGSLQAAVQAAGADLGLAFDGDADRCLAVDARGELVDGDQIMAMLALDLQSRGELAGGTVVVTVMTNLGFKLAMAEHGVSVVETKVGDRYVLDALEAGRFSLGGEQSGHVLLTRHASTGDGVLTGLAVADLVARSGRPLADLAGVMVRLPQVLLNVTGVDRARLDGAAAVRGAVAEVEAALAGRGRVLLRPSGTEPVVRVMVEAPTAEAARAAAEQLAAVVRRELG